LFLAGGAKRFAYLKKAELTRTIILGPEGAKTKRFIIDLKKAARGDKKHDVFLKEEDYLLVKTVPEWRTLQTVSIDGEVQFPGEYGIKRGETLSSLIMRAGGFTKNAYLKGAEFTRESVRILQQKQLDESLDRLERAFFLKSIGNVEAAAQSIDVAASKAGIEQKKALIAKLRAARAKGRISIKLSRRKFRGTSNDITLEDKDSLIIPDKFAQIQVIGSVYNQTAFIHEPGGTVSYYLKKAGGTTKDGDQKAMYILKSDGTAIGKSRYEGGPKGIRWDSKKFRWISGGGFMNLKIDPGDTIVVPEKLDKIAWLRNIKDITQILFQMATAAGVVFAIL
jgi:protein involved in polysaccharide export with SLBB domain